MSDFPHNTTIPPEGEQKQCEQCQHRKLLTEFHRRQNKTDGRMRICAQCYMNNLHETQRHQQERQRQRQEEKQLEQERLKGEHQRETEEFLTTVPIEKRKLCPRCKQPQANGNIWHLSNGDHIYYPKYCNECTNNTPHTIYRMRCPITKSIRYFGIGLSVYC